MTGGTPSNINRDVMRYLVAKTEFSAEEVRMLHRHFRRGCAVTSKKHKHRLGRDEFVQLYKETFPWSETTRFAHHAFRIYDQDRNGKVDFQEFVFMLDTLLKGSENDKLTILFQLYDIDGSHQVSQEEANEIVEDLKMLKSGFVPKETTVSVSTITDTIYDKIQTDELTQEDFFKVAQQSKTMQVLLESTTRALCQPLVFDAVHNKRVVL